MAVTEAYVLALMLKAQPRAGVPWGKTYETTAAAIAKAAHASPLFSGDDGEEKTAALMVGTADMESTLKPDAEGDCSPKETDEKTGMCKPGGTPHSFCLFQIHDTNFAFLGTSKDELKKDVDKCATLGLRLMHFSFEKCKDKPVIDRMNQYAAGGASCPSVVKKDKGQHRIRRGKWLFDNTPKP